MTSHLFLLAITSRKNVPQKCFSHFYIFSVILIVFQHIAVIKPHFPLHSSSLRDSPLFLPYSYLYLDIFFTFSSSFAYPPPPPSNLPSVSCSLSFLSLCDPACCCMFSSSQENLRDLLCFY